MLDTKNNLCQKTCEERVINNMGKKNTTGRSRSMAGMFYLDSTSYNCNDVILKGMQYFEEFRYILHDKDTYDQEDYDKWVSKNGTPPEWQVGDYKKPHYHFVGYRTSACHKKTCAKVLGITEFDVDVCDSYKGAIQYLIHFNNEEKYQYDISDIKGNKLKDLLQYFTDMTEYEGVKLMLDMRDKGYTWRDILVEMGSRGLYATFRRNMGVIKEVRNEYYKYSSDELEYYNNNVLDKSDNNE